MLAFKSDLVCKALPDGENWELYEPLIIDLGFLGESNVLTIPKGFVTDFGSVPAFLQWFVNPQGKAKPAYVLHDYLYRAQITIQLVADSLLNEGMTVLGVNWFQRAMVYRGLRLGGWVAWNDYAKKKATNETSQKENTKDAA